MKSLTPNRLTTSSQNFRKQKLTGELGESLAIKFLLAKGYEIITRNYRIRGGEIDIVAKKGGIIVFVEVKTRRGTRFGEAFEAIDYRKKQKLLRAIRHYLADTVAMADLPPYTPWQCDLIAISMPAPGSQWKQGANRNGPTAEIRHYKNIFLI